MHTENVIEGRANLWLAIDPKGFVGEKTFDAAWWLRDPPAEGSDSHSVLSQRLERLVEMLDLDRERTLAWARASATVLVAARVSAFMHWDALRHAECARVLKALQ